MFVGVWKLIWALAVFSSLGFGASTPLCGRYVFEGASLSLSDTEKKLICGDPTNEAWDNIPNNQAFFSLRNFLEDRGYYRPQFETVGTQVFIRLGEVTRVEGVVAEGAPPGFNLNRFRRIQGEILTPKLLNEIRDRINDGLRREGFPCPEVDVRAQSDTGQVTLLVQAGSRLKLSKVVSEPVEGMNTDAFRRYDAFSLGDPYQGDWVHLTENRIFDQSLVQSSHFNVTCTPDGAELFQKNIAGPPRLVTLGFGVDTEEKLIFQGAWKNLRLGKNASLFEVGARASFLQQSFNLSSAWYILPNPSRFFLKPSFSLSHRKEENFALLNATLRLFPTLTADTQNVGFSGSLGPAYNWTKPLEGTGKSENFFFSIGGDFRLISHDFEYFRSTPRSGFDLGFSFNVASEQLGSPFSASALRLSFSKLWDVRDYEPSFLILGLRGAIATTLTGLDAGNEVLLPEFRQYLGGSADLRGFGRQEVPGVQGALSSIFLSGEARFTDLLPYGFQPFTFVDGAFLGTKPLQLDGPLYWSPGIGLRWQSPVGVFRATLSHGFVSNDPASPLSHWTPYFKFGQEF